ncbi:MAG: flagellar hook capping FlgD N-terminal domain-containing protein [bacterium]
MSVTTASQITDAAIYTAQMQAAQPKATGAASKLGSQEFLNLMMKQLQYQDPMEPVSNTEFIAQQAQFTQLSTTQEMNSNIASNNTVSQALSLVGKNVTLTDPNDFTKTITGNVTSSTINGKSSTINVNGNDYALTALKSVNATTN